MQPDVELEQQHKTPAYMQAFLHQQLYHQQLQQQQLQPQQLQPQQQNALHPTYANDARRTPNAVLQHQQLQQQQQQQNVLWPMYMDDTHYAPNVVDYRIPPTVLEQPLSVPLQLSTGTLQ